MSIFGQTDTNLVQSTQIEQQKNDRELIIQLAARSRKVMATISSLIRMSDPIY